MALVPLVAIAALAAGGTRTPPAGSTGSALAVGALTPGARTALRVFSNPSGRELALTLTAPIGRRPARRSRAYLCPVDLCPPPSPLGTEVPRPRVKRTEIFLAAVASSGVEPAATLAAYLAVFPLRVQWWPATPAERAGLVPGANGLGHVYVFLRWSMDAENRPVFELAR